MGTRCRGLGENLARLTGHVRGQVVTRFQITERRPSIQEMVEMGAADASSYGHVPLARSPAQVNVQRRASYTCSVVRAQVHHKRSHFAWFQHPADGGRSKHDLLNHVLV